MDYKRFGQILAIKLAEADAAENEAKEAGLADSIVTGAKGLGGLIRGAGVGLGRLGRSLNGVTPEGVAKGLSAAKSYLPLAGGLAGGGLLASEGIGALGQHAANNAAKNYTATNAPTLANMSSETANQWRGARPSTWVKNLFGAKQPAAQPAAQPAVQ
jgi:hypothetical protein